MRIATDEKMTETFGGIMTGNITAKNKSACDGLLYGAAGLASIGFAVMGAERVAGHVSDVAPPLDTTDVVCLLALGALAYKCSARRRLMRTTRRTWPSRSSRTTGAPWPKRWPCRRAARGASRL